MFSSANSQFGSGPSFQFAECVSRDSPMTSSKLKASLKWPPSTPKSFEQLQNLEVLHEGLDLYLWLRSGLTLIRSHLRQSGC